MLPSLPNTLEILADVFERDEMGGAHARPPDVVRDKGFARRPQRLLGCEGRRLGLRPHRFLGWEWWRGVRRCQCERWLEILADLFENGEEVATRASVGNPSQRT